MVHCSEDQLQLDNCMRLTGLEGLISNITMDPVNAISLQDMQKNHDEQTREEMPVLEHP